MAHSSKSVLCQLLYREARGGQGKCWQQVAIAKNIRLLVQPTHSPQLNPIELIGEEVPMLLHPRIGLKGSCDGHFA